MDIINKDALRELMKELGPEFDISDSDVEEGAKYLANLCRREVQDVVASMRMESVFDDALLELADAGHPAVRHVDIEHDDSEPKN